MHITPCGLRSFFQNFDYTANDQVNTNILLCIPYILADSGELRSDNVASGGRNRKAGVRFPPETETIRLSPEQRFGETLPAL
ncbi:MAG: hypothetical protein LBU34_10590 [Planctomycetaceae bacterium]|jgi:hypothetical protein|nr:hypothetical protein [Planctomycetaceae bacterium]